MPSILIFTAVLLMVIPILRIVLPDFSKQKELANIASLLNKSEVELQQLNQGMFVRMLSQGILPRIDEKWSIDRIFGRKLHEKYLTLGKKESYFEYISGLLVKSLIMVPPVVLLSIVAKNTMVLLLAPISVSVLFYAYINDINSLYKKRQNSLIRDLPNLISKMMIALEAGKSFTTVFQQVSESSNPILGDMLKRLIANAESMPMRDALQIFAQEINIPVMYDFVSVVNVGLEKGYKEASEDFLSIKNNLRELRRLSLIEQTKGNPGKMNIFYFTLIVIVLIFLFRCFGNVFAVMNTF